MPPTRHVASDIPGPALSSDRRFSIPSNGHLLVTTPSHICAWDRTGLSIVFTSSKSGIVAAREAKDGSGILAVADKYVVVLHDTKRGQERSWGLTGDDDEVRHLEYAQDAHCLFLSTSLTSDIQRYSTERSRLLSPTQVQVHSSAPIALAVSNNGKLVVSASDNPPTIYIKDLSHNSAPLLLEPRASQSAVSVAAFHPERAHILLLASRDGALAAYDTMRMSRKRNDLYSNQELIGDGEISRFTSLHRTTSKTVSRNGITGKAATITGAAFLPGYKTRAISVGSDGRVRVVDFGKGGVVLRTWHAKAPLTSVCVLPVSAPSQTLEGGKGTDHLIAVGRTDGKVHIYDSVGLLLAQKTVSDMGERVISVDWVQGPSPRPVITPGIPRDASDAPTIPLRSAAGMSPAPLNLATPRAQPRKSSTPRNLGLPAALRRADLPHPKRSARRNTQFVVHPDEESTVRYTPAPDLTLAVPSATGQYLDLFSPVKAPVIAVVKPKDPSMPNSPRSRLRLSSQTFLKSPVAVPLAQITEVAGSSNPPSFPSPESHATSSGSHTARPTTRSGGSGPKTDRVRRISTHISPLKHRRASSKRSTRPPHEATVVAAPVNDNAKILADLRKLGGTAHGTQNKAVLATYANTKVGEVPMLKRPALADHPALRAGHKSPAKQKAWHPGNVLERESTWPTDSVQDESLHENEDDIWLTDESDKEAKQLRRRRLAPIRPPGRQTSRSRVNDNGTMSTVQMQEATQPRFVDGSTEDDRYATAHTHLSPGGAFSPASEHVRQLFPRASSLSPTRKQKPSKSSRSPRDVRQHAIEPHVLHEMPGNATLKRQAKSPWAKAKANKNHSVQFASKQQPRDDRIGATVGLVRSPGFRCLDCAKVDGKVAGLTDEVACLKAEVLSLKAAMRRSGVPLPPTLLGVR